MGFCGGDNDENDYEIGAREERALLRKTVAGCALIKMHPQGPSFHAGWNAAVLHALDAIDDAIDAKRVADSVSGVKP